MKLIVDTNRIIAALIKDSYSRKILLSEKFEFCTLHFGISETKKYEKYMLKKTKLSEKEFVGLMNLIFSKFQIFDENEISPDNYKNAMDIMGSIDKNDVPFIALALQIENDGIWSDDKHFLKQKKIKIWPTKLLVQKL
ncbi:MAG TPA: PIN domain-containing protein [archaeon]|nr:PIN domain-containing protein [archaeon]